MAGTSGVSYSDANNRYDYSIVVTGPPQSGKTRFCSLLCPPSAPAQQTFLFGNKADFVEDEYLLLEKEEYPKEIAKKLGTKYFRINSIENYEENSINFGEVVQRCFDEEEKQTFHENHKSNPKASGGQKCVVS